LGGVVLPLGTAATNALEGMCSNAPVADPSYDRQMSGGVVER